jgi:hypothetical protein
MMLLRTGLAALVVTAAIVAPCAAHAEDDLPSLEFFYPLVTGRPVIEREIELKLRHESGREGRETELALALELPLLPRWQVELEVPLVFRDPRDGEAAAGAGDIAIENKVLLLASLDPPALLSAGLEVHLPTGSERRGLGGDTTVEPFVRGAVAVGDFDLLAEIAYEIDVSSNVDGEQEQELTAGVAAGWRKFRRVTPLIELTTVTRVRGEDEEDTPRLRGRTQVYLTPGVNFRPLPRTTVRLGIQLPVTGAREQDYVVHAGIVREF